MLRIGHRGACGYAPENTLRSFDKALKLGCDAIEFDVHVCGSGEVVVIHDATVDRTTDGSGTVSELSLAQLKTLNAGKKQTIPTLQEALDHIGSRATCFIELKDDKAAVPVAEMIHHYVHDKGRDYADFLVIAFHHELLLDVRDVDPQIRTGALLVGIPVTLAQIAEDAEGCAIHPAIGQLNKALVVDAHNRGLAVYPWTANTSEAIEKARMLGVDGLASDYPDRI